jgi:hypothetical protein
MQVEVGLSRWRLEHIPLQLASPAAALKRPVRLVKQSMIAPTAHPVAVALLISRGGM